MLRTLSTIGIESGSIPSPLDAESKFTEAKI
jgi:hypothetical protein